MSLDSIAWKLIEDVPNSGKPEALAESLHDAQVCVLFDERDCTCILSRKINVGFVNYDYAFEVLVF